MKKYVYRAGNGMKVYTFSYSKGLNLGSGLTPIPGFVNLDYFFPADVKHDLNNHPYPFKDGEFDLILATNVMEHLKDDAKFLKECHRILRKGGYLVISVPHQNGMWACNPEHKRPYTWSWFEFFSRKRKRVSVPIKRDFEFSRIVKRQFDFFCKYQIWNRPINWIANCLPLVYEYTPFKVFPCENIVGVYQK